MRKLNEKFGEILERRRSGERGLTLIELLVVMIIIGILAAIAIPIFMNQQKTARDSATVSDVKNVATNIQSGLVKSPDATAINITDDNVTAAQAPAKANGDIASVTGAADGDTLTPPNPANNKLRVWVDNEPVDVTTSKGTKLTVTALPGGGFQVRGWNPSGKAYTSNAAGAAGNALVYDSTTGGLKK